MELKIRQFAEGDYEAVARVFNAAYVDADGQTVAAVAADDFRKGDAERPDYIRFLRLVAEANGQIVGVAEYDQASNRYHPRKFWFDICVDTAYQRKGVGSALYDRIIIDLLKNNPLSARGATREDLTQAIGFLEQRGWRVAMTIWYSELNVADARLDLFAGTERRMSEAGIAIKTLTELASDPQRNDKLYDLVWEVRQDLPDLDEATRESYEDWLEKRVNNPSIIPDAYFIATRGDEYLGYIYHFSAENDPVKLKIAQLGVGRHYRGQGIAVALKVRSVEYARDHGYQKIETDNESNNHAILSINERLGFVRRPAWVNMLKQFAAE